MIGLIESREKRGRFSRCSVRIEGGSVLKLPAAQAVVEVPAAGGLGKRGRRALENCAQALALMRVRRVFFANDFPYGDFFLEHGFQTGGCGELLRLKAAEILALSAPAHLCALLCASRMDKRAVKLLLELGSGFRYVFVDLPSPPPRGADPGLEDAGLCLTPLRADRTADVDAAVFLDAPTRPIFLSARCRTLLVCDRSPNICGGHEVGRVRFTLPEALGASVPEGFAQAELLSAALELGTMRPEDVTVTDAR